MLVPEVPPVGEAGEVGAASVGFRLAALLSVPCVFLGLFGGPLSALFAAVPTGLLLWAMDLGTRVDHAPRWHASTLTRWLIAAQVLLMVATIIVGLAAGPALLAALMTLNLSLLVASLTTFAVHIREHYLPGTQLAAEAGHALLLLQVAVGVLAALPVVFVLAPEGIVLLAAAVTAVSAPPIMGVLLLWVARDLERLPGALGEPRWVPAAFGASGVEEVSRTAHRRVQRAHLGSVVLTITTANDPAPVHTILACAFTDVDPQLRDLTVTAIGSPRQGRGVEVRLGDPILDGAVAVWSSAPELARQRLGGRADVLMAVFHRFGGAVLADGVLTVPVVGLRVYEEDQASAFVEIIDAARDVGALLRAD